MRVLSLMVVLASMAAVPAVAESRSAEAVVADAISYHDPDGAWASGAFRMTFAESRPDGSVRDTVVVVDNARGRFEIDTGRDGHRLPTCISPDLCTAFGSEPSQTVEKRVEQSLVEFLAQ